MDDDTIDTETESPGGLSRRQIIQRGALVGAVAWTAPVIATFRSPAGAQTGSVPCDCFFCAEVFGIIFRCIPTDPSDCDCLCCCGGVVAACATCSHPATPCTFAITCFPDPSCVI